MERLESIEELLKRVERQQEELKALEPLLGSVDSVLHFDSLFSQYRKRLSDLAHTSSQVADYTASLRAQSSEVASTATLQAGRRLREIKALEAKASAVERLYGQMQTEGREWGQRVVEEMKGEKEGVGRRFEEKLEFETQQVKVSLRSEQSAVRTELEQAKSILRGSDAFSQKEQGTASLVTDLQAEIEARARSVTAKLEEQHSSMSSHIQSGLFEASSRLCTLRSSTTLSPSLLHKGAHLIACLRLHLDSLYPGLMQRAQTCSQLASNLSDQITTLEVTKAAITEEIASVNATSTSLATEFARTTKELESCFDLVSGLETAVQSAVPQERVQLMTKFRSEVKARQYQVKKAKTQREVERTVREVKALVRNASALSSS